MAKQKQIKYVQTIPLELVGKNPELKVLRTPFKGDLPSEEELTYSDDYTRVLDKLLPVAEIFGNAKKPFPEDFNRRLYWSVGNTPFENTESEDVLRGILWRSAGAGIWQPYIQVTSYAKQTINELMKIVDMPKERYTGPGYINPNPVEMATRFDLTDNGRKLHFAEPIALEDKLILVPTEHLVKYTQVKFKK